MNCNQIIEALSDLAPFEYAENWDNVGLLVGSGEKEISKIFIALDATDDIIDEAVRRGADMLLTHHPLIFSPVKKVVDSDFIGRRIIDLIKNDISYVVMHTNFDIMGMADAAADELSLKHTEVLQTTFEDDIAKSGLGRVGYLSHEMDMMELAERVKRVFRVPTVRMFGNQDDAVYKVAILPGSGRSGIDDAIKAGADVYITGDIDHHTGIDALARGLNIIDAGHYGIEKLFIPYMKDYIRRNLKGIEVELEEIKEPFTVV